MNSDRGDTLPAGTSFGVYRIVRILGVGGMGAVYEAIHTRLNKRVALKTVTSEVARDPVSLQRFLREGETAARIRHPNAVDITDVGVQEGRPFFVMEFLEGEDLATLLKRSGPIPATLASDLLLPVIAAVSAAHSEGIVHRDIKPQNIFLARTRHGQTVPKLLDFGISKVSDSRPEGHVATATNALLGTPYYMSPEQVRGEKSLGAASDQYSLGVVLYECVAGRPPFDSHELYALLHKIISGTFAPLRSVRPDVPPGFELAVQRAMSTQPDQRFASVDELGAALLPSASAGVRHYWVSAFGARTPTIDATGAWPADKHVPDVGTNRGLASSRNAGKRPPMVRGRLLVPLLAAVGSLVAATGLVWHFLVGRVPSRMNDPSGARAAPMVPATSVGDAAPRTILVAMTSDPASAEFTLDGERCGEGRISREVPEGPVEHVLVVSAPGFVPRTFSFREVAPPRDIRLERVPPSPPATLSTRRSAEPSPPPPRAATSPPPGPAALRTVPEAGANHDSTFHPANEAQILR